MKVLVFAPHNDDEVLGVGGTIARMSVEGHEVYVCEVTSGKNKERTDLIKSEARNAHSVLGVKKSIFLDLPVVELKTMAVTELNKAVSGVVKEIQPDIAFIPHKGDMHRDHYEVAMAAMVALRPVDAPNLKAIYAYETLSETEWNIPSAENLFVPSVWVDISDYIELKEKAMSCYNTQIKEFPNPRSIKAIRALSEYRGSTICKRNSEAFMLIRQQII